ncbi:Dolichyl-diphosphooligosaccharide-protein glycosyltransferase [Coccomyxa sp. Obi]|nr:Dolichyl-diphosphooligosaccharide-protein glycosyltransferase [Coccomyxa sp. Obi]
MGPPLSFLISLTVFSLVSGLSYSQVSIEKAEREFNAAKQYVVERDTLEFRNAGTKAVLEVVVCHPSDLTSSRAFFEVVQGITEDAPELEVKGTQVAGAPTNATCEAVVLDTPLLPGKATTLETYSILMNQLVPKPKEITQTDVQRVLFTASRYPLSPYKIATASTQVKLPSKNTESYQGAGPVSKSGATVTYGPNTDVQPFSGGTLSVHFENNAPFAEAVSLVREIEVSHWGNVYVEENYNIKHTGAVLKGEWSRLRYMQDPRRNGAASIKEFTAVLPRSAHSLYFRDEIGNVSTSSVKRQRERLEVRLQPRFVLFGGWQVEFLLGYSLKLNTVVNTLKGGLRQLSIPFSTPILNLPIQDLTVKVVLPEGSSHIKADFPFEVEQWMEKKYTYLDTHGRPVLVLKKHNVVPDHNMPLKVTYKFASIAMLQEPLLLVGTFFAFFCALIVYTRFDFRLSPTKSL